MVPFFPSPSNLLICGTHFTGTTAQTWTPVIEKTKLDTTWLCVELGGLASPASEPEAPDTSTSSHALENGCKLQ